MRFLRDTSSDQERFRQLYPRLLRFAAVVAPTEDDPNDLVQEAVAQTLRRHRLTDLQSPEHYLRKSILRLASNRRRTLSARRRANPRLARMSPAVDSHPSDLADLLRLPPSVRAVLFLVEVEGWTYRQVSDLLGCSEQAARARASRGLRQLRTALMEETR